ncbi:MAG: FAD-dependent monooxygenase [Pseudonocardiales bacterium]|nr:FAD-dependent monooxygenase [Pseudonocardiales bacterium]
MDADVIVVGAGPTGLLLAGDLAEAGVAVTVLERRSEESNLTRAFAVHARTMEHLEMRGLADELATTGTAIRTLRLLDRVQLDLAALPSTFASALVTPQYQTERVLQQRATALGARLVHGAEVTGVTQDEHGVEVAVRPIAGRPIEDTAASYRAAYAVGADGVHSAVRQALGLPFPGRSVIKSLMLADVRLSSPPPDMLSLNSDGDGFAFVAPFGDGWYRVIAWNRLHQVGDTAPVELEEIREVTRRAMGSDLGMHDPRWLSRFHSDERQVPRYRVGRVFLAGDAAHCHSPAGGLGMNTGLQDAANLSWKLAAAVQGWGNERLLDSYHAERHPIGRQVVRTSGAIVRLMMVRPRWGRAVRSAIGQLLLGIPPVAARVAATISGIGIRYPAPRGVDPRVGTRVPDIPLVGSRLYEALRGGRFVLIGADAARIDLPPQVDAAVPARPTGELLLVRPDGYLAWIGTAAGFPAWASEYFHRRGGTTKVVNSATTER